MCITENGVPLAAVEWQLVAISAINPLPVLQELRQWYAPGVELTKGAEEIGVLGSICDRDFIVGPGGPGGVKAPARMTNDQ